MRPLKQREDWCIFIYVTRGLQLRPSPETFTSDPPSRPSLNPQPHRHLRPPDNDKTAASSFHRRSPCTRQLSWQLSSRSRVQRHSRPASPLPAPLPSLDAAPRPAPRHGCRALGHNQAPSSVAVWSGDIASPWRARPRQQLLGCFKATANMRPRAGACPPLLPRTTVAASRVELKNRANCHAGSTPGA